MCNCNFYYYYNAEFECVFSANNEMLYTKHIIIFSLGNSSSIMFSGEVKCTQRWLGHYNSPDNTIG